MLNDTMYNVAYTMLLIFQTIEHIPLLFFCFFFIYCFFLFCFDDDDDDDDDFQLNFIRKIHLETPST